MGSEFRFADRGSRSSQEGMMKGVGRATAGSLDSKLDAKRKSGSIITIGGSNPNEFELMWSGTKLMWRTNDTLIVRLNIRQDILACCVGNSDKDEEYDIIYLNKEEIKVDLAHIEKKYAEQNESKWKNEAGDNGNGKRELLREFYGNFVLARLNFVTKEDGKRNVVVQKSGSDSEDFEKIFTVLPEGWAEPPRVQRPKRRSFQDFLTTQEELKQLQNEMSERNLEASRSQKAMHLSMQMLDIIKNKSNSKATGLRKLRLRFQSTIQMRMVAQYEKRLESSPVYKELLKEQASLRSLKAEAEAQAQALATCAESADSTIPKLPPISPRISQH